MSSKGRKIGRQRKTAQNTMYKTYNRLDTNRKKRIAKDERRQVKKNIRLFDGKIKERGTTRKLKRKGLTINGKKNQANHSKVFSKSLGTALSGLRSKN